MEFVMGWIGRFDGREEMGCALRSSDDFWCHLS